MVCGPPEMNKDCREMFTKQGWLEGNTGECGDFHARTCICWLNNH